MFEDLGIGPFVGISNPEIKQKHINDIIDQNFFPIAMVEDSENEVFDGFRDRKDFETKAVFVTVYYKKLYE